jgi:hypothetical protein
MDDGRSKHVLLQPKPFTPHESNPPFPCRISMKFLAIFFGRGDNLYGRTSSYEGHLKERSCN